MNISEQIYDLLIQGFSGEELKTLCFKLNINYDDLPAQGRSAKALELVRFMARDNRLQTLVAVGAELRPNLAWPDLNSAALAEAMHEEEIQRRQAAHALAGDDAVDLAAVPQSDLTIWTEPHGEPNWVKIPAGRFWLGSSNGRQNEQPEHELELETFLIARFPITNVQYNFFIQATDYVTPEHWFGQRIPTGYQNHPVRHVSYYDALAYCHWLSEATGQNITLPSEAQWEKAARGTERAFVYPWGTSADPTQANTAETSRGTTMPVDSYLNGASPFGVVDTCGNVWEWTRSLYKPYPYRAGDGREAEGEGSRVLRGGAFLSTQNIARCSYRSWEYPDERQSDDGFRVIIQV